jgi:hypothetical protein
MIKSRRMKWAGHAACIGEKRNPYWCLVGKPEGRRSLERYRHWWEDNIKMDLWEIGWSIMDWIKLAHDIDHWLALVNTVINFGFHNIVTRRLKSGIVHC